MDFENLELFAVILFVNELTPMLPTSKCRRSHHQLYTIRNTRRYYARGEKQTLFRLLVASAGAGAKDPRDQLFSLAGIASGQPLPYPPDYIQNVQSWYKEFSAHAIRTEPGMTVLAECFLQPERLPDLPSWAHDWTVSHYIPYQGNHPRRIFNADGNNPMVQKLAFDGNTLNVNGLIVDEIAKVGSERYPEVIANIDESQVGARNRRAETLVDMVKEIVNLAEGMSLYSTNVEAFWQALWRTLIGDEIRQQNLQNSRVDQNYEQKLSFLKPLVIGNEEDLDWGLLYEHSPSRVEVYTSIHRVSFQRRICVTKAGRLGWVSKYSQEGDAIAIIAGIGVPMTLRSKMADYEIIGNSYIHGIMDGELTQTSRLQSESLRLM
jgi:hypothetical protein